MDDIMSGIQPTATLILQVTIGRNHRRENEDHKTSLQTMQYLLLHRLLLLRRQRMNNSLRLESSTKRRRLCFDTFKAWCKMGLFHWFIPSLLLTFWWKNPQLLTVRRSTSPHTPSTMTHGSLFIYQASARHNRKLECSNVAKASQLHVRLWPQEIIPSTLRLQEIRTSPRRLNG